MHPNNTEATTKSPSSALYCQYAPSLSWDLNNSTFHLILAVVTFITSLPTVLLNAMVILAVKQKKELQKPSNILLSSLAVTDLLIGAIVMPLSITVNFLIFRQVSFEHTCMLLLVNPNLMLLLFLATLYHLTIIAWERYVAIQKWMDYKFIITNSRLKKLAITAWLSALFSAVPILIVIAAGVDRRIVEGLFMVWTAEAATCLILITYFYVKVYLAIREHKINEIHQVTVLMKVKLESKVSKTTGLLTAALLFSFIPISVFAILANVFPAFRTNAGIRFVAALAQWNSLFNPLLYCYRDRRFRNAIGELLRMKKSTAIRPAVDAGQFVRRKDPFGSSELHNVRKRTQRLTRSASCNPNDILDSVRGTSSEVILKISLTNAMLDKCNSSLDGLELRQSSSILVTSATIHAERGAQCKPRKNNPECTKDANMHQVKPHGFRNKPRSKSCDPTDSVKFANRSPGTVRRPKTAKTNFTVPDKVSAATGYTTRF